MDIMVNLPNQFNSFYLLFTSILLIFMLMGIALFTSGLIRAQNTITFLIQLLGAVATSYLCYFGLSYQLIFLSHAVTNPYFPSLSAMFSSNKHWGYYFSNQAININFIHAFFQYMLVAIALSIILSATAERLRLWAGIWFSLLFTVFIYPIPIYWSTSAGFLHSLGFIDQSGAGSVYLAATGAALAGLILLGTRHAKYIGKGKTRKIFPITGSSLQQASLGIVFIWLGSLGFNTAYLCLDNATLALQNVGMIFLNTTTAAAASLLTVMIITRIIYGKTDVSLSLNGVILGLSLVAAQPIFPSLREVLLLSIVTGALGSFVIVLLDKLKIDDPIGAVGSFGIGSAMSLGAAAITANQVMGNPFSVTWAKQLAIQLAGGLCIFLWSFIASFIAWLLIMLIVGLRLNKEEE